MLPYVPRRGLWLDMDWANGIEKSLRNGVRFPEFSRLIEQNHMRSQRCLADCQISQIASLASPIH